MVTSTWSFVLAQQHQSHEVVESSRFLVHKRLGVGTCISSKAPVKHRCNRGSQPCPSQSPPPGTKDHHTGNPFDSFVGHVRRRARLFLCRSPRSPTLTFRLNDTLFHDIVDVATTKHISSACACYRGWALFSIPSGLALLHSYLHSTVPLETKHINDEDQSQLCSWDGWLRVLSPWRSAQNLALQSDRLSLISSRLEIPANMQRDNLYDGRHHRATSSTSSQPPMPGSPTLTNPDMILPDYEAPLSPDDRAESPLTMWTNANLTSSIIEDYHLPPQNQYARTMPSSTPIIYGNGTMLSDIGEVTEVESNAGVESRRTSSRYSTQTLDGPRHSMMNNPTNWTKFTRDRRMSVDSTSTITTRDRAPGFADVDDNMSVGDSNFQGDDEESVASPYAAATSRAPQQAQLSVRRTRDVGEERYSANLISDQAEEILANAKRRLLVSSFHVGATCMKVANITC